MTLSGAKKWHQAEYKSRLVCYETCTLHSYYAVSMETNITKANVYSNGISI